MHVRLHLVTGLVTALTGMLAAAAMAARHGDPRFLAGFLVTVLVGLLWRATVWRARPVYLDDVWLVVGRPRRTRRIPLAQVARIDRPSWAFSGGWLAPLELQVRGGPPVLFFPAAGAEVMLRARVHGG